MEKYCDLHTHSLYSDGTLEPAQLILEAEKVGLSAVALCDHNTVKGLPTFLEAARNSSVETVAGIEFSTEYQGKELHIAGLFLNPRDLDAVSTFLEIINIRKEENNRKLIHTLHNAGFSLDYDTIRRNHPEGSINRAVIASALLEKGYVSSVKEAFRTLLSEKHGYYIPPERIDVFDAITFLRSVHAVPVLAHPFLSLSEGELRQFLPEAKNHGLLAMETRYSTYTPEIQILALTIAREYGLLSSGGSDFHGDNKPDIALGTGKGTLHIPAEIAETLQEAVRK